MTAPGSSGTGSICRALCRTKVWLMPWWHFGTQLGSPLQDTASQGGRRHAWEGEDNSVESPEKSCSPDNLFGHWEMVTLPLSPGKSPILGSPSRTAVQKHLPHCDLGENSALVCKKPWIFIFLICFAVCKRIRQLRPAAAGSISPSIPPPPISLTQWNQILKLAELPLSIPGCGQGAKVTVEGRERIKKRRRLTSLLLGLIRGRFCPFIL